jgi:hypothetical protein
LKQNPGHQHKYFWLDAGNERFNGQVIIGNSLDAEPLLSPLGYCIGLPLPHLQEPGLLVVKCDYLWLLSFYIIDAFAPRERLPARTLT